MKTSRAIKLIGLIAVCAILFFASRRITISNIAHAQIKVSPFTAQIETFSYDNPKHEEQLFHKKTIARRSDGAMTTIDSVGPIAENRFVRNVVYLDGRKMTVFDLIFAKSTRRLSDRQLAEKKKRIENPPPDCSRDTENPQVVVAHNIIAGLDFLVLQGTGNNQRLTTWVSPRFGCQAIQYKIESKNPDGSFALQTFAKLVEFHASEPDPTLFDERANYDEVKPSVAQKRFLDAAGHPEDIKQAKQAQELDKQYEAHTH